MKQLAVWLHAGQLPLQLSSTRAPMKSSRPLLHPQSHTSSSAAREARRWKGLVGTGRLLFMIKRVLVSCAVLLAGVFLACSGDSGTGDLPQKPQIVTDRDSIVDTLCPYSQTFHTAQGRGQVLAIVNKGQNDLTVSSLTLSATDPSLVTRVPLPDGGAYAPFLLVVN